MKVSIFLLCHNEEMLLKHTINHYRKNLSNVNFIIYDNYSSDNSVNIAKELGCEVIMYNTNNMLNEYTLTHIKNNCWKDIKDGWIIICDMDEWLCVTDRDLKIEQVKGTTILSVKGYNIICDSKVENLEDIDLHKESKAIYHHPESKNICFFANSIKKMNYCDGAHQCNPIGKIKFSEKHYLLKHMDVLGLPYKIYKHNIRYERSRNMAKKGVATHYTNDINSITNHFNTSLNAAIDISNIFPEGFN